MVTKAELLNRLTRKQLEEIARAEGIRIPSGARKAELVKRLTRLRLSRIRELVEEYTEEIERTTIIKEKIKRKRRTREREKLTITMSKEKIIMKLVDEKIPRKILEIIGERYRFAPYGRSRLDIYRNLDEDALEVLYRIFVKKEYDRTGRFLEYRTANWIIKRHRLSEIKIRDKIIGKSGILKEADVAGYDENGDLIVVAECKSRGGPTTWSDISKWIETVSDFLERHNSLRYAYFVSKERYIPTAIKEFIHNVKDGILKPKGLKRLIHPGVELYLLEERRGKMIKIFPD